MLGGERAGFHGSESANRRSGSTAELPPGVRSGDDRINPGEPAYAALAEQHAELRGILESLTPDQWNAPSSCAGWTVSDVVMHLAQTDEIAVASLDGAMDGIFARLAEEPPR